MIGGSAITMQLIVTSSPYTDSYIFFSTLTFGTSNQRKKNVMINTFDWSEFNICDNLKYKDDVFEPFTIFFLNTNITNIKQRENIKFEDYVMKLIYQTFAFVNLLGMFENNLKAQNH